MGRGFYQCYIINNSLNAGCILPHEQQEPLFERNLAHSLSKLFEHVSVFVHEVDGHIGCTDAFLSWLDDTHGLLFFRIVTGMPVLFTSAVTREKLFLASSRPIVNVAIFDLPVC